MITPRARSELERHCRGELVDDAASLALLSRDFGGIIERAPALVLRPSFDGDVVSALSIAREHGIPVCVRGAGHGQAGQSLGTGLVLDMTSLGRVWSVDEERSLVEVEAGATWRSVVEATFARGYLPVGLTHALDTTVAGTLSVGGVGAESYRVGPQVDNVVHIDVATLDHGIVRTSAGQGELFDLARAGLGQCCVILRVGYPIRRCEPRIRTRAFAYEGAAEFLADLTRLARLGSSGCWLTASFQRDPLGRRALTPWLFLGEECGTDLARDPLDAGPGAFELPSRETPIWTANGAPGHPFFQVFAANNPARYETINPWVENLFPMASALPALEEFLGCGATLLGDANGSAGGMLIRRGPRPAPLFVTPQSEHFFGLGAYPRFSPASWELAERTMGNYASSARELEGKRYLSGYVVYSVEDWKRHYGAVFEEFARAKRHHDPQGLLGSSFIAWPDR